MDGLFACLEEDHENAFALQCIYPLFLTSSCFFLLCSIIPFFIHNMAAYGQESRTSKG